MTAIGWSPKPRKLSGGVDGLVCNAALFSALPIQMYDEIDPELWDEVMRVNVKGPWLCARAAVPAMERAGGGSIVMVSTNRIFRGYPGLLHYDASKGGVLAMTRSLIRELGPRNIRVNTIAPGLTMSEGVLARDGIGDRKARHRRGAILVARSGARRPDRTGRVFSQRSRGLRNRPVSDRRRRRNHRLSNHLHEKDKKWRS